jgi:hypothetical protein
VAYNYEHIKQQRKEDPSVTSTETDDIDELETGVPKLFFEDFHEYYMMRDQLEYIVPIVFEDGMDYEECEQYYASMKSNETSKLRSCLRTQLQRKSSLRELQQIIASDSPSCLRRMPRHKSKIDLNKARVRRCSFGGTAPVPEERPTLQRSNSHRDVNESSPGVSFSRDVLVWTVFHSYEYPDDIRSQMWMSRDEMRHCMQRAVAEKVAERRRQIMRESQKTVQNDSSLRQDKESERLQPEEDTEKKEIVRRQNSGNCVVDEYRNTSNYLEAAPMGYEF